MRPKSNTVIVGALLAGVLLCASLGHAARTPPPLDTRSARGSLFEWSPLVEQIQQFLIEFDLLTGPTGGRMTAETQQAIRAYQKQSKLPVDGEASEALLKHMESVGRAETLKRRLARARDRQIEKARNALQNSAATRDLLQPGKSVQNALAPDQVDTCLRDPDIDCLLSSATASVEEITRKDYRDWALRDVVRAHAAAGRTQSARAAIKRLSDLRLILVSLREAAAALAEAGYGDDAFRLTQTIPDPWNKARALLATARAAPEQSQALDALLTLLPQLEDRDGALELAAELLADLGERGATAHTTATQATIRSLLGNFEGHSPIALGAVAAAYARTDLAEEAQAVIDHIGEKVRDQIALAEAAGMLARQGKTSEAMTSADRLRTPQLYVLATTKIAAALLQRHQPDATAAILTQAESAVLDIERPFAADTARAQIAAVWIDLGQPEHAFTQVAEMHSRTLKAQTLWELATNPATHGTDIQSRAVAATEGIESAFDRAATLARAARGFAEASMPRRARNVFALAVRESKAIQSGWWRARILSLLARVHTKL